MVKKCLHEEEKRKSFCFRRFDLTSLFMSCDILILQRILDRVAGKTRQSGLVRDSTPTIETRRNSGIKSRWSPFRCRHGMEDIIPDETADHPVDGRNIRKEARTERERPALLHRR